MKAKNALSIITLFFVLVGCAVSPSVKEPLRWTVAESDAYGDALIVAVACRWCFRPYLIWGHCCDFEVDGSKRNHDIYQTDGVMPEHKNSFKYLNCRTRRSMDGLGECLSDGII